MFGQGATYDSMHFRFREYRSIAAKLKAEASPETATPSTPRNFRNVATATGSKKRSGTDMRDSGTPSKKGKSNCEPKREIILLDDSDEGEPLAKTEIKARYVTDEFGTTWPSAKLESSNLPDIFGPKREDRWVDSQTNGYTESHTRSATPAGCSERARKTRGRFHAYAETVTEYEDMA